MTTANKVNLDEMIATLKNAADELDGIKCELFTTEIDELLTLDDAKIKEITIHAKRIKTIADKIGEVQMIAHVSKFGIGNTHH